MYLELYLVAVEFLILKGDHLEKLFPSANFNMGRLKISEKHGLVLIAALVILPTTWLRSMGLRVDGRGVGLGRRGWLCGMGDR